MTTKLENELDRASVDSVYNSMNVFSQVFPQFPIAFLSLPFILSHVLETHNLHKLPARNYRLNECEIKSNDDHQVSVITVISIFADHYQ